MKLIKPSVEHITEPDMLKRIEMAGRACWQSEDKICEGSAEKFVMNIIKRGHESVLEHSNIVVECLTNESTVLLGEIIREYEQRTGLPAYIRNDGIPDSFKLYGVDHFLDNIYSGNLRAWRSITKIFWGEPILHNLFGNNILFEDIYDRPHREIAFESDVYAMARVIPHDPYNRPIHRITTFKFTCSRGIANELVRHRCASFSQSSTRYINYSTGVPFIKPWWYDDAPENEKDIYRSYLENEEQFYIGMFSFEKPSAGKSRSVLPSETACTLFMTATDLAWQKNIFPLRCDPAAHKDAQTVMHEAKWLMGKEGLL